MAPIQISPSYQIQLATLARTSFALPASSSSIALFFFANHVAHCATVKQFPGEKIPELFVAMVLTLFFPCSGISRALESIVRYSTFRRTNELQRVTRASALCIVARSNEWRPVVGDVIRDVKIKSGKKLGSFAHTRLSERPEL